MNNTDQHPGHKPRRVYISAPMTGFPNDNIDSMIEEEAKAREWFKGHGEIEIINPARLPKIFYRCLCVHPEDPSIAQGDPGCECPDCGGSICTLDYRTTIIRDMLIVDECDVLWLADGWENSLGCCLEVMTFIYGGDFWWIDPRDSRPFEPPCDRIVAHCGAVNYCDPANILRQYLRGARR